MNEVAGIERDFQIERMNETIKQKKQLNIFGATSPIGFNQSGYLHSIKETPRKIHTANRRLRQTVDN